MAKDAADDLKEKYESGELMKEAEKLKEAAMNAVQGDKKSE